MHLYKTIFLWLTLGTLSVFSQEETWSEFQLEDISASFPTEEVYILDTISDGLRVKQLFSQYNEATLLLQRTQLESDQIKPQLSSLPHDKESLISYYQSVAKGVKKSMQFNKVEQKEIAYKNLVGYLVRYSCQAQDLQMESQMLLAGKDLIIISYLKRSAINDQAKAQFFESLNISALKNLDQFTGVSKPTRQGYIIGKLGYYAIFGVVLIFLLRKLFFKEIPSKTPSN